MNNNRDLAQKNMEISFEFSRYLLAHPELERKIPENAFITFHVVDDPKLTAFNNRLLKRNRSSGQTVVTVHIKGLAPTRLLDPEVSLPRR